MSVKGDTSSFLFILRSLLIKLDSVVPTILFCKSVISFKTFSDIVKAVIESKYPKMYF